MLLYVHGGVYMDLDVTCLRPFEESPLTNELLQRSTPILFHAHESGIQNAWMAAPRRHPFFRFVVEGLKESFHHQHPLDATGPRFLARRYLAWRRLGGVNASYVPLVPSTANGGIYTQQPCSTCVRLCGDGTDEARLNKCTKLLPNYSAVTFWHASWAGDYYTLCAARHNGSTADCHPMPLQNWVAKGLRAFMLRDAERQSRVK